MREEIIKADPLLNNAEADWFKDQFERMALAHGFPTEPGRVRREATRPCPRDPGKQDRCQDAPFTLAPMVG